MKLMRSNRVVRPSDMMPANANAAKVLGSIPVGSSDTVEPEGRQMKQCLRKYFKRFQKCPSLKLFGGSGKLSFYIFQADNENDDLNLDASFGQ